MHINFESKLCVQHAYYTLWANHMSKNIDSFYTQNKSLYAQNESLYNKLSFDMKYKDKLTHYKAMNFTSSDYPL